MKNLLVFFAVMLSAISELSSAEPDKKLHNGCLYPTVMIQGQHGRFGSGVIVKSEKISKNEYRNVVITCAHLFHSLLKDKNTKYTVRVGKYKNWSAFQGYENYKAIVYEVDMNLDTGVVLFASKTKMPVAQLGFDVKFYIGTDVFRIGCGVGDPMRLDYGKITSVRGRVNNFIKDVIRTSVYTVSGDSGGPLFGEYKVIGIAQAHRSLQTGFVDIPPFRFGVTVPVFKVSYYIPIDRFKTWNEAIDNEIGFVYKKEDIPVLPFLLEEIKSLVPKNRELRAVPWVKA